jgi:predicted DNA-binding protein YlxM (UPF0122 family)
MGKKGSEVASAERRQKVLDLRIAGFSLRRIAEQVGVSHTQVSRDIEEGLAELAKLEQGKTEVLRQRELERLDKMQMSLWQSRGNPKAAMALLKLVDQRSRLLGLYMPTKIATTDPEGNATVTTVDLTKLSSEELRQLRSIQKKAGLQQLGETRSA